MVRRTVLGATVVLTFVATAAHAAPDCRRSLVQDDGNVASAALTADSLVRLRDIGTNGTPDGMPLAVTLSPDKRSVAFQIRRAEPDSNTYCIGMFVLDAARGGKPLLIDVGYEPIRVRYPDFRGLADFPSGVMATITPRWTSDSRYILFLKRSRGSTQIWRAAIDATSSEVITESKDDIVDFVVADDNGSIRYSTRPGLRAGNEEIDREGRQGFHYDDRFFPALGSRPYVPAPLKESGFVQHLLPPGSRLPEATESASESEPAQLRSAAKTRNGTAWITVEPGTLRPRLTLRARLPNGEEATCTATVCDRRISKPWWTASGRVRFFRREGWGNEATAIYEWMPGGSVRRLFLTNDVLESCTPVEDDVICLREGSTKPRYIMRLSVTTGKQRVLFDPNSGFAAYRVGAVERLHWKNREGLETFGDLVLPVGYMPGRRYPLIVVQYETRGFLRGGTGDEYPIQLYATNGYAVLSFNRPPDIGLFGSARTIAEAERADLKDFADRRSVQSALEAGVRLLVDRGVVNPDRIGITGLSDGASSAQFALLNSNMFKAAALSQCCWDASMAWRVGPGSMRYFSSIGYPGVLSQGDAFWKPISLLGNEKRIKAPILLQLSDSEYVGALPAYTSFSDQRLPVDLFVFPNETHIKWQPAHRLAVYNRSLAWFDFWLKGQRISLDAQTQRWMQLASNIQPQ